MTVFINGAQGAETMEQGLTVLVVGITTVFAFLILLVVIMQGSSWFFARFAHLFPEPEQSAGAPLRDDLSEIAVVLAALRAHKR
jgi:sodium pump decarboxylase gamma subunit